MVNQWGRDGNFSSSGARSSGSGIAIAAVVALLLGAGGGYLGARLLSGPSTSELQAREERISDLEKQISDLKFATSGETDQEAALRNQVQELTKANQTLKALVDENETQGKADAKAEIAALKKTIEEAGDVRAELNRARRSQQVSELQIIELEDQIKTQRGEIEKLRKSLTDSARQGDAGSKALSEQIKILQAALSDSQKQAASAADLGKQVGLLEDEIAKKAAELGNARQVVTSLQKQLDGAQSGLAKAKSDLAAANEQLDIRNENVRTLETQLASLRKDLDEAKARASGPNAESIRLSDSLAAMEADKKKLESEVATLRQTIERLQAAEHEDAPQPGALSGNDEKPAAIRRDAADVQRALDAMPGFSRLTADQQVELAQTLEAGECVADALKATLGRVPAIALRNLIRDLGSKC